MKLKEFELWAYKLDLPESRKFTLFSRSVCAHFERHFQAIDTDGIYRVFIKLSEGDDRDGTTEESSSVLKFYQPFDFCKFELLEEKDKKKVLLDTLMQSILLLCDMFDWPIDEFKSAYSKVIEENFINHYCLKQKNSPNRKLVAQLICHHESDRFDCYLVVVNKNKERVFSKLLFSEEPDEYLFNSRFRKFKWVTSELLAVVKQDKSGEECIKINV